MKSCMYIYTHTWIFVFLTQPELFLQHHPLSNHRVSKPPPQKKKTRDPFQNALEPSTLWSRRSSDRALHCSSCRCPHRFEELVYGSDRMGTEPIQRIDDALQPMPQSIQVGNVWDISKHPQDAFHLGVGFWKFSYISKGCRCWPSKWPFFPHSSFGQKASELSLGSRARTRWLKLLVPSAPGHHEAILTYTYTSPWSMMDNMSCWSKPYETYGPRATVSIVPKDKLRCPQQQEQYIGNEILWTQSFSGNFLQPAWNTEHSPKRSTTPPAHPTPIDQLWTCPQTVIGLCDQKLKCNATPTASQEMSTRKKWQSNINSNPNKSSTSPPFAASLVLLRSILIGLQPFRPCQIHDLHLAMTSPGVTC